MSFYLLVLSVAEQNENAGVNQGHKREREVSTKFPCITPRVWELLQRLSTSELASFIERRVFVDD